jgi:hypothetical protein
LIVKIAAGWLYWIVWQALSLLAAAVGALILLPLAYFQLWETRPGKSWMFGPQPVAAWRGGVLTALWCNEENGVTGADWYRKIHANRPVWLNAYLWSAWRNSANGLRWLPGAAFLVEKSQLTIKETQHGYIATHGWRQCVQWRRLRFGWLINLDADTGWRSWPVLEVL